MSDETTSGAWRKRAALALRVLVSAAVLAYLVSVVDRERVAQVLARVRPADLVLPPLLVLLAMGVTGLRWSVILRDLDVTLGVARAAYYTLVGNFYGLMLPGVVGGDPVRIGLAAASEGAPVARLAFSVVAERAIGVVVVVVIGALGTFALSDDAFTGLGTQVTTSLRIAGLVGAAALLATPFLAPFLPALWPREGRVRDLLRRLRERLRGPRALRLGTALAVFALSATAQCLDILAVSQLARAIGIEQPVGLYFVIVPMVFLVTAIPISLGGLGVREGALVFLLTHVGSLESDAIVLAFAVYLNRLAVAACGGLLQFFRTRDGR